MTVAMKVVGAVVLLSVGVAGVARAEPSVASASPATTRWLAISGLYGAMDDGEFGVRADIDVWARRQTTVGLTIAMSGEGGGTSRDADVSFVNDLRALVQASRTIDRRGWQARFDGGVGGRFTRSRFDAYDRMTGEPTMPYIDYRSEVAVEVGASVTRRIGAEWGVTVGATALAMPFGLVSHYNEVFRSPLQLEVGAGFRRSL